MEQKDDFVTSNVDSDSRENNNEDLKENMDNNPSFQPLQMRMMTVRYHARERLCSWNAIEVE